MAHFMLTLRARGIEGKCKDLEKEKKIAVYEHMTKVKKKRSKYHQFTKRVKIMYRQCCSWIMCEDFFADGTFPNYVAKSFLGFIGGFFLTYIFFIFFVFQLNFTLSSATILGSVFGVILTIGLAFSFQVRCVVFLLLPQFFTKRGRQAVVAYAFILSLTGPAKNTLQNMVVLSESLACAQEQLKSAVKQIIDLVKQPFYAIRDAIKSIVRMIKKIVVQIKRAFLSIKRIIMNIINVIKAVFQWLSSIINVCNKKLGTPFDRCMAVFDNAISDCRAKLGPLFSWLCSIAYLISAVCYAVKFIDYICLLLDFLSDSVVGNVKKKFTVFVNHVRTMFYVSIQFSHSFHFETNQSKTLNDITKGIVTEIRQNTDIFLSFFDWMCFATSFFFFFIILKVLSYRNNYLKNDRFDNKYITKDLRTIDLQRAKLKKETILPLNRRERNKFIPLASISLIKSEKVKLAKSFTFLGISTLKLMIQMLTDYFLYWLLANIRYYGRIQTNVEPPNIIGINIIGSGVLKNIIRAIVKAFSPVAYKFNLDPVPCLPDPIPPDIDRYVQIISLIVLCWLMAIFEPYGLRIRQIVMAQYHPNRSKQRAVWLYNHIIRSRGNFLKLARRKLRTTFVKGKAGVDEVTFMEFLRAKLDRFWCARRILGKNKEKYCIMCGTVERKGDTEQLTECAKPGCVGLYCKECYGELQNICTLCLEPVSYGDISDISEEIDSSDDSAAREQKVKDAKRQRKRKKKKHKADTETSTEDSGTSKRQRKRKKKHKADTETSTEDSGTSKRQRKRKKKKHKADTETSTEDSGTAKRQRKRKKKHIADTETSTEDSGTTTNSDSKYDYQYERKPSTKEELDFMKQTSFKDVEAQKPDDYATMQMYPRETDDEQTDNSVE